MTVPAAAPAHIEIPAVGSYVLDPVRSTITFVTHHFFGTGKVNGSFPLQSGQVVVAEPLDASRVHAVVEVGGVETGNARRDHVVRSAKLLDAARYPTLEFDSQRLALDGDTPVLHGVLTAHGQQAAFELTVTRCTLDGDAVDLEASGAVDRYAHGVTGMKGMTGRRLHIAVTVHATRS